MEIVLAIIGLVVGVIVGVQFMRRAYLAPIDSGMGQAFDLVIGPLPEKQAGDVSTQSSPMPRFRF